MHKYRDSVKTVTEEIFGKIVYNYPVASSTAVVYYRSGISLQTLSQVFKNSGNVGFTSSTRYAVMLWAVGVDVKGGTNLNDSFARGYFSRV